MNFVQFILCFSIFEMVIDGYAMKRGENVIGKQCIYKTRPNEVYSYDEAGRFCRDNNGDLLWFKTKEEFDKFRKTYNQSELESKKRFTFWILAGRKYDKIDGRNNQSSWSLDDGSRRDFPFENMPGFSRDNALKHCGGTQNCLLVNFGTNKIQTDCCNNRHGAVCASHASEHNTVEASENCSNLSIICSIDLYNSTSGKNESTWKELRNVVYLGIGLFIILFLVTFCFIIIVLLKRFHKIKKLNAAAKAGKHSLPKKAGTKKQKKSHQVDQITTTQKTCGKNEQRYNGNDKATEIISEKLGKSSLYSSTIQPHSEPPQASNTLQSVTMPRSFPMSRKTKTPMSRSMGSDLEHVYEVIEPFKCPKEAPILKMSPVKCSKQPVEKRAKRTIRDFVRRSKLNK